MTRRRPLIVVCWGAAEKMWRVMRGRRVLDTFTLKPLALHYAGLWRAFRRARVTVRRRPCP